MDSAEKSIRSITTTLGELVEVLTSIARDDGKEEVDSYEYASFALLSLSEQKTVQRMSQALDSCV